MSSTSRPTASEIRGSGGVQQFQQRPVAQGQRAVGDAVATGTIQQGQHLVDRQALGQPPARRGGRTARATSSSANPSAAANRCSPRTAISARAARHRRQRDLAGIGIPTSQRHQELADVILADLSQIVNSPVRQVLRVAAQVRGDTSSACSPPRPRLDRQMVEVAPQLCLQAAAELSTERPSAPRTPWACRPTGCPAAAAPRTRWPPPWAVKIPATSAMALTILTAEHQAGGPPEIGYQRIVMSASS